MVWMRPRIASEVHSTSDNIYTMGLLDSYPPSSHNSVYALYDSLSNAYPHYITMNILGVDNWGNEIREYVFKNSDHNDFPTSPRARDPVIKKPKILITTGIHGDERGPVLGAYNLVSDLCAYNPFLIGLRSMFEIRLIPVACPTAYNGDKRSNDNGVNLARNFSFGWVLQGEPGDYDYSGPSPASELETQLIEAWLSAHSDCLCYLDYHNTGYSDREITYFAASKNTEYEQTLKNAYLTAIGKLSGIWYGKYKIPESQVLGYTGHFDYIASPQRYAYSLNIPSMVLETTWQAIGDGRRYGPITNAITTEYLGNLLVELTKHLE